SRSRRASGARRKRALLGRLRSAGNLVLAAAGLGCDWSFRRDFPLCPGLGFHPARAGRRFQILSCASLPCVLPRTRRTEDRRTIRTRPAGNAAAAKAVFEARAPAQGNPSQDGAVPRSAVVHALELSAGHPATVTRGWPSRRPKAVRSSSSRAPSRAD